MTQLPIVFCRLAHALARSFNFQGRVNKIFYVLKDDKVGSGPRLQPQSLLKPPTVDLTDESTDMDVDISTVQPESAGETSQAAKPTQPSSQTPSAKLAALATKRKASEPLASGEATKTRR